MGTHDFFCSRLDQMIDLRHPLAVLSTRLPWNSIEAAVAPKLARQVWPAKRISGEDLAGSFEEQDGIEQLLKAAIETAVEIKAVKPADLERVIVDSTVQSKAIAHPVDSRLLEIARHKVVSAVGGCDPAHKSGCETAF